MGGSLTHFMPSRLHEIKVLAPIAVQAQDLRSFAMWLSPHIHPEKYRPENPQAASRPVFFGMTARLVEKIKNPLTTGRRSDNV